MKEGVDGRSWKKKWLMEKKGLTVEGVDRSILQELTGVDRRR